MWVAEEVSPLAYAPNAPSVEMRYVIHSKALHFVARNQVSKCYVNLFQQALARAASPVTLRFTFPHTVRKPCKLAKRLGVFSHYIRISPHHILHN
jgi:hypothetical protein